MNFYRILRQRLTSVFCTVLVLLTAFDVSAAHISRRSAMQTASEFLNLHRRNSTDGPFWGNKQSTGVDKELVSLAETEAYYVFAAPSARGFVIVAADDGVSPVVGYSDDAVFDPASLPPALQAYLSDYSRVVGAISSGAVKYQRSTRGGQAVAPLMAVKWDQGDPYNRLAPDKGSDKAYTGCVATAIAQVMKYHRFPVSGRGVAGENNIYYPDQKIELGHAYDWNAMLDEYVTGAYNDAQADAVATLMRDVGYSVNMDYGYNASSALTSNIPAAMCRHFNYSPDIKYVFRSCYSTQGWTDEIRASLLRSEPVLYGGVDGRNSGHQFVCDGIDSDDMLHINWGWGGYGDGYFDMNILSPEYLGIGAGEEGAYYREQDMIFNIRPGDPNADNLAWRAPVSIDKVSVNNTAFDENGRFLPNNSWDDNVTIGFNFQATNSTGFKIESYTLAFALMISDASGNPVGVYNPNSVGSLEAGYYRKSYVGMDWKKGMLPDGHYSVSIVLVPNDKGQDAKPTDILPLNSGDLNCVRIKVENGDVYLEDMLMMGNPLTPSLKLTGVRTSGKLYAKARNQFTLTVRNTSSIAEEEYYDVYLVPASEDKSDISLDSYQSYASGNIFTYPGVEREIAMDCWAAPDVPGRYRVYLSRYSSATQSRMIMPSDEPFYVDVLEMPTDRLCMVSALKLNKQTYCRNTYIRLGVDFAYNNPGSYFSTDMELWARPKGSTDGYEFMLLKKSGQSVYAGSNTFSVLDWSDQDVVWYEPFGEYEAYIKYTDADGNLRVMDGDGNLAGFTLTASDATMYAELSAPVVVNNGRPVEAVDWTYFDVEIEFMTTTGLKINTDGSTSVDVYRSPRSGRWLDSFTTANVTFDKTELAPGEKTKAHARILYRAVDSEPDLIGTKLYIQFNYLQTEEGSCRVHPGEFIGTTGFRLGDDGSGIGNIAADGATPVVTPRQGGLTVSGIAEGSAVSLYTLDGRCVRAATAGAAEMQIDGIAPGLYLVSVLPADGVRFAAKVIVR